MNNTTDKIYQVIGKFNMDQKMTNHLQKSERIQIETLLKIGMSIFKISSHLGRDRRTIYREINRSNADSDVYEAEIYS